MLQGHQVLEISGMDIWDLGYLPVRRLLGKGEQSEYGLHIVDRWLYPCTEYVDASARHVGTGTFYLGCCMHGIHELLYLTMVENIARSKCLRDSHGAPTISELTSCWQRHLLQDINLANFDGNTTHVIQGMR